MIQAELLNSDTGSELYGIVLRELENEQVLFSGQKFLVLSFLCGILGPIARA